MRTAAALAVLLAPLAAAAQPSFDCADAAHEVEQAICADDALAQLDAELDRLYRAATGTQTGDALAQLQDDETSWIEARDTCAGTPDDMAACIRDLYAMRIHDLLDLAPATGADADPASLGPFLWACEGLPAPVSSAFVNLADSLVSLRWGAEAIVLPRAISASGARYATPEPQQPAAEFWTRGDTAMFTPPGGARADCALVN